MASRIIIQTPEGLEIYSAIQSQDVVILEPCGQIYTQSPKDFIRLNPIFDKLSDKDKRIFANELLEKSRHIVNSIMGLDK